MEHLAKIREKQEEDKASVKLHSLRCVFGSMILFVQSVFLFCLQILSWSYLLFSAFEISVTRNRTLLLSLSETLKLWNVLNLVAGLSRCVLQIFLAIFCSFCYSLYSLICHDLIQLPPFIHVSKFVKSFLIKKKKWIWGLRKLIIMKFCIENMLKLIHLSSPIFRHQWIEWGPLV